MACRVVCGRLEVIATFCPIERVGQRRLAGVRTADEAGEAGAEALRDLGEHSERSQLLAGEPVQDLAPDRQGGRRRGRRRVEDVQHRARPLAPARRTGSRPPACRRAAPPARAPRRRPAAGRRRGRRAASAGSAGPSPCGTATGAPRRGRSASAAAPAAACPGRPATRAAPAAARRPTRSPRGPARARRSGRRARCRRCPAWRARRGTGTPGRAPGRSGPSPDPAARSRKPGVLAAERDDPHAGVGAGRRRQLVAAQAGAHHDLPAEQVAARRCAPRRRRGGAPRGAPRGRGGSRRRPTPPAHPASRRSRGSR